MAAFSRNALIAGVKQLSKDIWRVYWLLVKIMVPALVVIKLLDTFGLTKWLAWLLAPLMGLVGLPESMGIVWATAMLTNIYTGMAVFFQLYAEQPLTVAQVTVLGTMILVAHALVIEGAVAKAAGISWQSTLCLRVVGALVLGFLLNMTYQLTGTLQSQSELLWQPESIDTSLQAWIITQFETMLGVLVIIASLMTFLRLLRLLGIEKWMHWLLYPALKLLGIGREAANVTVIGMTLGLGFGGGLLVDEARSGKLSKRDVFLSMSFLGLCHSIIEDTLLIALLGADLSGILWARLLFAFVVIGCLSHIILPRLSHRTHDISVISPNKVHPDRHD